MKFRTKPRTVTAIRITDQAVGPVGSWLVLDGDRQQVLTNDEFLTDYQPAGRGESKEAYEKARVEAGEAPAAA